MPPNRMHLEECRLRETLSFKALFELENGIDEVCIECNLDVKKRPSTFTSELGYASSTQDFSHVGTLPASLQALFVAWFLGKAFSALYPGHRPISG